MLERAVHDRAVDSHLRRGERDFEVCLPLGGQRLRELILGAAQHERPYEPLQLLDLLRARNGAKALEELLAPTSPESIVVEKRHKAEELVHVVLHRGAGEQRAVHGAEGAERAHELGVAILETVRLVHDDTAS